MKKTLIIFLALTLMLTFAACGEKNGGKAPSESPAPSESGNTPSGEEGKDENKYYGIGEAAEVEGIGIEITIDQIEIVDDTSISQIYTEGFVYVKVYATAKNVSDEIKFAEDPLLRIVRDGEYDAELSDDSRNSYVWNFNTDGMYFEKDIKSDQINWRHIHARQHTIYGQRK